MGIMERFGLYMIFLALLVLACDGQVPTGVLLLVAVGGTLWIFAEPRKG